MVKFIARLKLLIPDIFLAVLLSSGISLALSSSLLIDAGYFNILMTTITAMFIFILLFWNLVSFLASFSAVSLVLVIFVTFLDKYRLTSRTILYVSDSIFRVYNYIIGDGNINGLEGQISSFICYTTALIVFFIIIKLKAYNFAIVAGGILFAAQSILEFIDKYTGFYIFMVAMVCLYTYSIFIGKHKNNELNNGRNIIFIASVVPLALILFLSSAFMPFSNEPIQWTWMDNKVIKLYNNIIDGYDDIIGKNDYFSLARTGFGREGKLGGSVEEDNTEVLKVWGPKPAYLKAIGRDTYTGNGWKDSFQESKDLIDPEGYAAEDLYEMNFGLKLLGRRVGEDYASFFHTAKYEVRFLNMKTKSFFIPKGIMGINNNKYKVSANVNLSTSMDSKKKSGFRYEVIVQSPRYESDEFISAMLRSHKGLYNMVGQQSVPWQWDDREELASTLSASTYNRNIELAEYAKRAENIRSIYTSLPDNMPGRIRELAVKVTEVQKTDYEKAKAIETYLSKSFPYTLKPGSTPDNRDFVDYFLFDQKQGYCVHYATAMAVMARAVGLPSRYVEGYMMPHSQNDDGSYTITNQNAHSWVEIYFEGAGWVQFEPTAAFNQDFYRKEEDVASSPQDLSFSEEEENLEPEEIIPEDDIDINANTESVGTRIIRVLIKVSIVIIILVVVILTLITLNIERYRHKIRKFKKLGPSQGMVKLYNELLRVMKKLGYGILDNETAIQYGKRIDGLFYFNQVSFESLSVDFTEARYSGRQIDRAKLESYDIVHARLLEIYKKEKGKLRFIIEHYLIGSI